MVSAPERRADSEMPRTERGAVYGQWQVRFNAVVADALRHLGARPCRQAVLSLWLTLVKRRERCAHSPRKTGLKSENVNCRLQIHKIFNLQLPICNPQLQRRRKRPRAACAARCLGREKQCERVNAPVLATLVGSLAGEVRSKLRRRSFVLLARAAPGPC
jgi:hypothetical protein